MREIILYFFAISLVLTITMFLMKLYRTFFKEIDLSNYSASPKKMKPKRVERKPVKKAKTYRENSYQERYTYVPYEQKKCVGYDGPVFSNSNYSSYEEYSRRNVVSR